MSEDGSPQGQDGGAGGEGAPAPRSRVRRERMAVLALFLLVGAAYLASVPGVWHITPDSAVYLGLARSLARGEGYRFNGAPFGKYPPVFPAMLALVYRTLGQAVWAMQGLVALCGVGALAAGYALVKRRAGTRAAAVVVLLGATCTWFWVYASVHLLSEVPYALFSLAALWLAERAMARREFSVGRWLVAVAVAVGAILTHLGGVALIPALAGGALVARGPSRSLRQRGLAAGLAAGLATAAAAGWVARGWLFGHAASYASMVQSAGSQGAGHLWEKVLLRLTEWPATPLSLTYRQMSPAWGAAALALLVVPGLVVGFRRFRSCLEIYVCAYFAVSAAAGGWTGRERYVVPVVPLLFYYGSLSLAALAGGGRRVAAWARRAAPGEGEAGLPRWLVVAAVLAVAGPALYGRVACRRGAERFSRASRAEDAQRVRGWGEAAEWIEGHLPQDARIQVGSAGAWSIIGFFIPRPLGITRPPDDEGLRLLRRLAREGTEYAIVDLRRRSRVKLAAAIEQYPQGFPVEWQNRECSVHRVDPARLAELLAAPPAGDPAAETPAPAPFR